MPISYFALLMSSSLKTREPRNQGSRFRSPKARRKALTKPLKPSKAVMAVALSPYKVNPEPPQRIRSRAPQFLDIEPLNFLFWWFFGMPAWISHELEWKVLPAQIFQCSHFLNLFFCVAVSNYEIWVKKSRVPSNPESIFVQQKVRLKIEKSRPPPLSRKK